MKTHKLKTWCEPYNAVCEGRKRHEYRLDDRGFEVGDVLHLREFNHEMSEAGVYTGRWVLARVTYVSRGPDFGIPEGYVVMSISTVINTVIGDEPID